MKKDLFSQKGLNFGRVCQVRRMFLCQKLIVQQSESDCNCSVLNDIWKEKEMGFIREGQKQNIMGYASRFERVILRAGAMLIFSVLFQFQRMSSKGQSQQNILPYKVIDRYNILLRVFLLQFSYNQKQQRDNILIRTYIIFWSDPGSLLILISIGFCYIPNQPVRNQRVLCPNPSRIHFSIQVEQFLQDSKSTRCLQRTYFLLFYIFCFSNGKEDSSSLGIWRGQLQHNKEYLILQQPQQDLVYL